MGVEGGFCVNKWREIDRKMGVISGEKPIGGRAQKRGGKVLRRQENKPIDSSTVFLVLLCNYHILNYDQN